MHFDRSLSAVAEHIIKGDTDPVLGAKFFNRERASPNGKRREGRGDLPTIPLNDGGGLELEGRNQLDDQSDRKQYREQAFHVRLHRR